MTASVFAERVLVAGKDGPSRISALKRRRRARAAFHAAAQLVEAVLEMQVFPRAGDATGKTGGVDIRLRGRAIACHVAKEAFSTITIHDIAIAAGVDRRTASAATYRLWNRRDEDPELQRQVEMLVLTLRAMGGNRGLLAQAWAAGATARVQPKRRQP